MGKSKDLASGAAYQDQTESDTRYVNTSGDSMTGELLVRRARSNTAGDAALTIHPSDTTVSYGLRIDQNTNSLNFDQVNNNTTKMSIDSSGRVTTPNQPGFWVQAASNSGDYSSGPVVFSSSNSNVTTSSLISNGGTHFNTTNGRFTAPVAGLYQFNVQVRIDSFGGNYSYVTLWDSGSANIGRDLTSINTTYYTHSLSGTRYLSANDYAYVTLVSSADTSVSVSSDSWFSGFLIG